MTTHSSGPSRIVRGALAILGVLLAAGNGSIRLLRSRFPGHPRFAPPQRVSLLRATRFVVQPIAMKFKLVCATVAAEKIS